jgi:dienelactone hydrolase
MPPAGALTRFSTGMGARRAFSSLLAVILAACTAASTASATPSVAPTTSSPSPSPAPTRTPRPSFASVTSAAGIVWTVTDEPVGPPITEDVTVWLKGRWPDGYETIAAIFSPPGDGPFPTVVYFHEAAGVTERQLELARRIAQGGFIVVAGCTLSDARVSCRRRFNLAETDNGFVDLAKLLPHARPGGVALVGASAGNSTALNLGSKRTDISAVVGDSGVGLDYPSAPVLLLASRADSLIGGEADLSERFEATLRARGTIVESHYYDNGGHIVLTNPETTDDAVQRTIAFLQKYATR